MHYIHIKNHAGSRYSKLVRCTDPGVNVVLGTITHFYRRFGSQTLENLILFCRLESHWL